MTANSEATGAFGVVRPMPGPVPSEPPAEVPIRPVPRLGRGIVWSDIVAEIARDVAKDADEPGMRDAA
ncbi:DUF6222 family protein [Amycolatopsis sp. NPDC024027]|uniref:DUF6222 family protein n=1 Tax=Amycolatopsis sp. NPDC024027 TaxID=3154327 RepID=UPI0033FD03FC